MLVRVQSNGRKILGLELRGADVRRYFPEHIPFIELELGELRIDCQLKPEFWRHQPLIADYRLSAWLEAKVVHGRACRVAPLLELTPCGKNSFALKPPGGCEMANCMLPPAVAESCLAGLTPGAARSLHPQQTVFRQRWRRSQLP